jgi:hypothetical protein
MFPQTNTNQAVATCLVRLPRLRQQQQEPQERQQRLGWRLPEQCRPQRRQEPCPGPTPRWCTCRGFGRQSSRSWEAGRRGAGSRRAAGWVRPESLRSAAWQGPPQLMPATKKWAGALGKSMPCIGKAGIHGAFAPLTTCISAERARCLATAKLNQNFQHGPQSAPRSMPAPQPLAQLGPAYTCSCHAPAPPRQSWHSQQQYH